VRTVTTIEVIHPEVVPRGVFEYQHGWGDSVEASISTGFDHWARSDLVPLLDALKPTPESCMVLGNPFPGRDGQVTRPRRAILGPVLHMVANQARSQPEDDGRPAVGGTGDEEHPFCPCCLLTRSFAAFEELFEDDAFHGIRLYAARAPDGSPMADCRVDGHNWEPGAQALREYVKTWPGAGFESRKQYVILQNSPVSDETGPSLPEDRPS
jgi:hypothetical protein